MSPLVQQAMDWTRSQIVEPPEADTIGDERRAEAALVHRVISGPDGPALMEILAKITVLRPALDPRLSGSASHDYAQRRTGENNVFAALVHLHDTHLKQQGTQNGNRRSERPVPVFGWFDGPAVAGGDPDTGNPVGDAAFDREGSVAFRG